MIGSKVEAMRRITEDTDRRGASSFPQFLMKNMEQWQREGLVRLSLEQSGNYATITDAGRKLAKSSMAHRS